MLKPVIAAGLVALIPAIAQANCATVSIGAGCGMALSSEESGAKRVVAQATTPQYQVGDRLPAGQYFMMMNRTYYGLPPIDGYWRYYRVEGRVLKVHPDTLEVIADATSLTNAAF